MRSFNKICQLLLILMIFVSIVESNTLEVKLFGTRRDINFLSIEGDIFRPLMYEFEDRDLSFISINLDSSDNYDTYKDLIEEAGGRGELPFIVIDETLLLKNQINKKNISDIIDRRAFRKDKKREPVQDEPKKMIKKFPTNNTTPVAVDSENMVYTNIFVAIIVVIGGVIVYYARKNLLR